MTPQISQIVSAVAETISITEDEVVLRGLKALLERNTIEMQAQIQEIHNRYKISSLAEMEQGYQAGTLHENDSWRDFQRLDDLEYKRDRIKQLLESLT